MDACEAIEGKAERQTIRGFLSGKFRKLKIDFCNGICFIDNCCYDFGGKNASSSTAELNWLQKVFSRSGSLVYENFWGYNCFFFDFPSPVIRVVESG